MLGVISGDRNSIGVTGIAPDATISASSFSDQSTSQAIKAAADKLGRGDIILLEIHRPGPNTPNPQQGQLGYIAIEWWPDDFAAIRYAVPKGIIVVEAAGNGFQNLDDAVYNTRPAGFPSELDAIRSIRRTRRRVRWSSARARRRRIRTARITDRIARDSTSRITARASTCRAGDAR